VFLRRRRKSFWNKRLKQLTAQTAQHRGPFAAGVLSPRPTRQGHFDLNRKNGRNGFCRFRTVAAWGIVINVRPLDDRAWFDQQNLVEIASSRSRFGVRDWAR
jgi:hypothetical protein